MRTHERGESKIGCILYLLVIAYVGWLAVVLVPVYYTNLQLKNEMGNIASSYSQLRRDRNRVKEMILREAEQLEIPLEKSDIDVRQTRKMVTITVKYQRRVNLLFVTKDLQLNPSVSKPFYVVVH